jgi:hypothetical protein
MPVFYHITTLTRVAGTGVLWLPGIDIKLLLQAFASKVTQKPARQK